MHNQLQGRMFLTGSAALGIASFTPRLSFADTVPATAIVGGTVSAQGSNRSGQHIHQLACVPFQIFRV